jgi:hypothetical protein
MNLNSKDTLTLIIKDKGLFTWNELTQFIKDLPYGRTTSRSDFSLVIIEHKGSDSCKHALLYDYLSIIIRLQNIEYGKISIFDISGKHYQTHKIREQHTVFGLNPGIYFIILHDTDEKFKILVK